MKILHISPASPFNDGWGYQENLLPMYQKKMGNEVVLLITNKTFLDGKMIEEPPARFVSKGGFEVVTLKKRFVITKRLTEFLSILKIREYLESFSPDLVFVHGLSNLTIKQVIRFKKKNQSLIVFVDNHADYNIGPKTNSLIQKAARAFWRINARHNDKWISKYYGVTPWRKTFAEDYYRIPSDKTDVLIMGADDEKMMLINKSCTRTTIRKKFNIREDDFLIVTGGKLDNKKKVIELMEACAVIPRVKLIVFGNVLDEIKADFDDLAKNSNIIYIGWIPSEAVYDFFVSADLVAFPGQHSVLWEQACASKTPCIFARWDGTEHIDNGGNSSFFTGLSVELIKKDLESLVFTDKYYSMRTIAESSATDLYLYSSIAKKTIKDYEDLR